MLINYPSLLRSRRCRRFSCFEFFRLCSHTTQQKTNGVIISTTSLIRDLNMFAKGGDKVLIRLYQVIL